MEKKFEIKTDDNHIIFGTLNSKSFNSKRLVIFVHGFTGRQIENHYFNTIPIFNSNDIDTFRFDFYSRQEKKARSLTESSITTHIKDLNLVINTFKDKYESLILVGHSLGALVILNCDLSNISKLVLWDPTTPLENIKDKNAVFKPELNKYIFYWNLDFLVSKEMVEEWSSLDLNILISNIIVPTKFIFSEKFNKHILWKSYLNNIKVKYESIIIEGATHEFEEEGCQEKLFEETLKFIKT